MRVNKEKSEKLVEKSEKLVEKEDKEVSDKLIKEVKEIKKKPKLSTIDNFIGKNVSIMLRGGSILKGKLESVPQYELILTISYKPVIVMKHAIDYIELSDEK